MEKKEYRVLHVDTLRTFEDHVRMYLLDGWELVGGVSVLRINSDNVTGIRYFQSVSRILPKE